MPAITTPSSSAHLAANVRYVEVSERLHKLNAMGAAAISLLTVVERWGNWRHVAVIIAVQAVVIAWNTLVNLVLLKRGNLVTAEVTRNVINIGSQVLLVHYLGWPFVCWLWLPYVAVAFDHMNERLAAGVTVAYAISFGAMATYDGVD